MTPPWTLQVETPTTLRLPDLWRVGKTAEGCTGGAADGSFQRVIEHWMERGIRKTKTSWMSKFSNKKPSDWSIPSRYCTHLERWWTKQGFRLFQNRHDGKEKQTQLPAFPVSLSPGRGLRRVPGLPRSKLPAAACGEVAAASGTSQVCSRRVTTRNETFPDGKWCATDLELKNSSKHPTKNGLHSDLGMDQYLLIPLLVGWTSIYQLFWCSPGVQVATPQGRGRCVASGQLAAAHRWWPRGSGRSGAALGGTLATNGRGGRDENMAKTEETLGFPHRCQYTSKKHSPRTQEMSRNFDDYLMVNLVCIIQ